MATYNWILSATLRDEIGTTATYPIYLQAPDTITAANLHTYMQDCLAVLDPITDAQIIDFKWEVKIPFSGAKDAPVAGGRVEQTGLFNFGNALTVFKAGQDVPAIANSTFTTGAKKLIDLTNAGIIAYTAFMTTVTLAFTPTNKFAGALITLLDAAITFRKHRKQLTRATLEV
jgi:hypothetical protein